MRSIFQPVAAALLLLTPILHAQSPTRPILKLAIHDTIQPVSAAYLQRGLDQAARLHSPAVLLSLGTPGGLLESTRIMVAAIEASPVPVVIFISPTGSRAGSAGFFLLEAADLAAMAPGTNAGAAHPIVEGATLDPILKQKIENDAAAFLRSYTSVRGRNVPIAEDAVRNSKSFSADEALQLHLIDLISPSDAALLAALDGRTIKRFDGHTEILHLAGAPVLLLPPSLRERLLSRLTNPDLAVLLLVFGGLLLFLEFHIPGTIIPGSLGTLLILLALFGLGLLPIHHAAVALLVAAVVLLLLEFKIASHGILALAGIATLIFGLITLVDSPVPELRVHPATALATGLSFGAISFALAWLALRARRNKILLGPQAMLGKQAVILSGFDPHLPPDTGSPIGQVEIRGEIWQARLRTQPHPHAPSPIGTFVIVRDLEGMILLVDPA